MPIFYTKCLQTNLMADILLWSSNTIISSFSKTKGEAKKREYTNKSKEEYRGKAYYLVSLFCL